jgi:hypothetical protein
MRQWLFCGLQILLAQLTNQPEYMEAAQAFCDFTVNYQKKTPKGLVYIDKFGTLCHAANVAFVCLQVLIPLQRLACMLFQYHKVDVSIMERMRH